MKALKIIPLLLAVLLLFTACGVPSFGGGGGTTTKKPNTEESDPVDPEEPIIHEHEIVADPAEEPTCTSGGKTEGSHCATCNEVLQPQDILPALGHDVYEVPDIEATGSTEGLSGKRICSRCNAILSEGTVIPALGYTVSFTSSGGSGHTNDYDLAIIMADNTGNSQTVWISNGGTYAHIMTIKLAAVSPSSYLNYTMGGVDDVLYNQGSGNPSAVLTLTGNVTIDCTIYEQECILAESLVTMADGSKKALGDIVVGDVVLSYDWETMQLIENPVIYASGQDTEKNWQTVRYFEWTFSDGTIIKQAFAHRFYNLEKKAFIYLEKWNIGDHIYKEDGTYAELLSVRTVYETCTFARIKLQYGTNYFANGALTGDRHCPTNLTFD